MSVAGPMFRRSIAFLDQWIAELTPKAVAPAATAPPAATAKPAAAADGAAKKEKEPKKERGASKAEPAPAASTSAAEASSMSKVCLMVGRVTEVKPHPESTKLFVEKIDMGKGEERTILSGLQEHVTAEEFLNRLVIVVANLEPRKIGGIPSNGMVLCASTADKGSVKLLDVPEGAQPGERLIFPGHEGEFEPVLKKKLAKHWEDVAPLLKTDEKGVANFQGIPFKTSAGPVTSSIVNGNIS